MRRALLALTVLSCLAASTGCTFVGKVPAADFHGVPGPQGKPIEYYSATRVGVHFLFIFPLPLDVSVTSTVRDMAEQIHADGGESIDITQSGSHVMWYLFPPFTFFVHPVVASAAAMVEVGEADETPEAGK